MEKGNNIFDHLKPGKIQVPDSSYFEQLTKKVLMEEKTKVIPIYRKPIAWIGAAAATIAVVLTIGFYGSEQKSDDVLLALNQIPKEEIRSYVENNIEDFDIDMIVEFIPEENLNEVQEVQATEIVSPTENLSLDSIGKDEILDYFEEEGIDPYDLEDESFI